MVGGVNEVPAAAPAAAPGLFTYRYPLVPNPAAKKTLTQYALFATIAVWGYIISSGAMSAIKKLK